MTQPEKKVLSKDAEKQVVNYIRLFSAATVITAIAATGILINNRRHLKFVKATHAARIANSEELRNAISSMRAAGREFSYYPGVGLYLDKVYQY